MTPIVYPSSVRRNWIAIVLILAVGLAGYLVSWLIVPPPTLPGHVAVPSLRGLPEDDAIARLKDLGLSFRQGEEIADPDVGAGQVSWQSPVAGAQVPRGGTVLIGLSAGVTPQLVPDLADLDLAVATQVLEAAGLKAGVIDSVENAAPAGVVLSSRPGTGSVARPGSLIALTVSIGEPPAALPNLVGMSVRDARARIESIGLRVGVISERVQGRAGTVLSQEPIPGTLLARGSRVDLTVSSGVPR